MVGAYENFYLRKQFFYRAQLFSDVNKIIKFGEKNMISLDKTQEIYLITRI